MATVKATKGGSSLSGSLSYVDKKAEITRGKDCPDEKDKALEMMELNKLIHDKEEGKQYYHYVQSFSPEESKNLTAEEVNKMGVELAEKEFPGHSVFVATHTDKAHKHNHLIVDSVNLDTGLKLQMGPPGLEEMKTISDKICIEHGLEVVDRSKKPEIGEIRSYNSAQYHAIMKASEGKMKSHQLEAAMSLGNVLEQQPVSRAKFDELMKTAGWTVKNQGEKHITLVSDTMTYKDKPAAVRVDTIAKLTSNPSWTKAGIEQSITQNRDKFLNIPTETKSISQIQATTSRIGQDARSITQAINAPTPAKGQTIASPAPSISHGGGAGGGKSKSASRDELKEKLRNSGMSAEQINKILAEMDNEIQISGSGDGGGFLFDGFGGSSRSSGSNEQEQKTRERELKAKAEREAKQAKLELKRERSRSCFER